MVEADTGFGKPLPSSFVLLTIFGDFGSNWAIASQAVWDFGKPFPFSLFYSEFLGILVPIGRSRATIVCTDTASERSFKWGQKQPKTFTNF